MSPYREPPPREPRPLPVLREEYDEALEAFRFDGLPGLRAASVACGLLASASPFLLTVSAWWLPLVVFT